jgi:protein-S-isoprenylcysteine O-methyltransferase Ste14
VTPETAVQGAWAAWLISWFAASAWSDAPTSRPPASHEIVYRLMVLAGAALLFGPVPGRRDLPVWRPTPLLEWAAVVAAVGGFGIAWWARFHMGRLWSSRVTTKADHRVVDTGPYALVRHPIYSGLILAAVMTAALRGTVAAGLGAALVAFGWGIKARIEERFLRQQLGPAYDAYAARVPMLVPFPARRDRRSQAPHDHPPQH